MVHRLSVMIFSAIVLATATACASTEGDAPISDRAGRAAAAGVPEGTNSSSTVRGGISSPAGP